MLADNLRVQFVEDVIIPLCEKYDREPRAGWQVFQAAYESHRAASGSFALIPDREERMRERVSYMMVTFFRWLYEESGLWGELRALRTASPASICYGPAGSPRDPALRTHARSGRRPPAAPAQRSPPPAARG